MKILILGGNGFLGRAAASLFSGRGHAVSAFSRSFSRAGLPAGVKRLTGDRRNLRDLEKTAATEDFDLVIDNIGFNTGDAALLAKTFPCKRCFFISASAVYSILDGTRPPYKEKEPGKFKLKKSESPDYAAYALGKLEAEKILLKKTECSVFRLPAVLGPGERELRLYSYLARIRDGGPIFLPRKASLKRSFLYSGDFARAMLAAAEAPWRGAGEVFNITGQAFSLEELVRSCLKILGKKNKIIFLKPEKISELGLDFPGIFPFSNREYSVYRDYLDGKKFEKRFSWKPLDPRQWLPKTVNWFMNDYSGSLPENYKYRKKEMKLFGLKAGGTGAKSL